MAVLLMVVPVVYGQEMAEAPVQDNVRYLGPDAFYIEMHSSVVPLLLDVREEQEYLRDRIPNSVAAPESEVLYEIIDTIDTEHKIFIYCDLEDRSETVASLLQEKGFNNLFILKGGISAWKATSLPLDKKRLRRRDLKY